MIAPHTRPVHITPIHGLLLIYGFSLLWNCQHLRNNGRRLTSILEVRWSRQWRHVLKPVNEMHHLLTHSIYMFMASNHSTKSTAKCRYLEASNVRNAKRLISEAQAEKNVVKKKLKCARKCGDTPEEVLALARDFYRQVRKLSKLTKSAKAEERKRSTNQQRKECRILHACTAWLNNCHVVLVLMC